MYKITIEQKNALVGVKLNSDTYFNPVRDINGDWFISIEEIEQNENIDINFLDTLVETNFTPPNYEI